MGIQWPVGAASLRARLQGAQTHTILDASTARLAPHPALAPNHSLHAYGSALAGTCGHLAIVVQVWFSASYQPVPTRTSFRECRVLVRVPGGLACTQGRCPWYCIPLPLVQLWAVRIEDLETRNLIWSDHRCTPMDFFRSTAASWVGSQRKHPARTVVQARRMELRSSLH